MSQKIVNKFIKGIGKVKNVVVKTKKVVKKGASASAVPVIYAISKEDQSLAQNAKVTEILRSNLFNDTNVPSSQSASVCESGNGIKKRHMKNKKETLSVSIMLKHFKKIVNKRKNGVEPQLIDTQAYVVNKYKANLFSVAKTTGLLLESESEVPETLKENMLEDIKKYVDETEVLKVRYPFVCSEENTLPLLKDTSSLYHSNLKIDQDMYRRIQLQTAVYQHRCRCLPECPEMEHFDMDITSNPTIETNPETFMDEDIESELKLQIAMFTVNGGRISAMSMSEENICIGNERYQSSVLQKGRDVSGQFYLNKIIDIQTKKSHIHGQPRAMFIDMTNQKNQLPTNPFLNQISKTLTLENEKEVFLEQRCLKPYGTFEIGKLDTVGSIEVTDQYASGYLHTTTPNDIYAPSVDIGLNKIKDDNISNFGANEMEERYLQGIIGKFGPNLQIKVPVPNPVQCQYAIYPDSDKIFENELNIKQTCTLKNSPFIKGPKSKSLADSKGFQKGNVGDDLHDNNVFKGQDKVNPFIDNKPVCRNEPTYKGFRYKASIFEEYKFTEKPKYDCLKDKKRLESHATTQGNNSKEERNIQCATGCTSVSKKAKVLSDVLKWCLLLANQVPISDAKITTSTALIEYSEPPDPFFKDLLQLCINYAFVTSAVLCMVYSVYSILRTAFLQDNNNQEEEPINAPVAVAGNAGEAGAVIVEIPRQPVERIVHRESYPIQCEEDRIQRGLFDPRRNRVLQPRAVELPFIDLQS